MPFTAEAFFSVFRSYNLAVWPAQPILLALALTAVFLASRRPPGHGEGVHLILAALWLWAGLVYHMGFFRHVNPGAWAFGSLFVAQAGLHAWEALRRPSAFRARGDARGFAGGAIVVYALLVYPLVGSWAGHAFPDGPSFGAPCRTTIFTFGVLLWAEGPVRRRLLVVPALWTLAASWAAWGFGVVEDVGLPVAAVLAAAFLLVDPLGRRNGGRAVPTPAR